MIFKENAPLYATELERKQGEEVLYVNMLRAPFIPSLADNPATMARVVEMLSEYPSVSRIVFVQQRNYHYGFEQISMLSEIARIYHFLTKQEVLLSIETLQLLQGIPQAQNELNSLLSMLIRDPVLCLATLHRMILNYNNERYKQFRNYSHYLYLLEKFSHLLEQTRLVRAAMEEGEVAMMNRTIYRILFRPDILPNFTFTRLVSKFPANAEMIDQYRIKYNLEEAMVTILKRNDSTLFYHIVPPEYNLSEEHHLLLQLARNVLIEHRPKAEEFTDPEKTRSVFFNVARDLISELASRKKISLNYRELQMLAQILVRYTIGFGLLEILLMDSRLQDIMLNAPIAQNPIFVRHEIYEECTTNIMPSYEDADSWAAKLRLQSGRPLDEANPVLDTDLFFNNVRARVAAIQAPLSPAGLAYAIRRHRDEPWTLPLFIKNKMLNSFAAGLLSFLIDGNRTILVAGTRSSGKTSLLGSLMLNVLLKVRMIVVEDTLELPVDSLRNIGYNIQRMKVRSALVEGSTEIEAAEGIRTSLRLGDSALIVGEVRSSEAKALYEAMRVGALANVVAGTIHGDSPYGVFDRVVNDLGVAPTSFKATDIIVIANPVKTADGLHSKKRVMSVTEVRKHWTQDPLQEGGFVDLLQYNVEKDELEPTSALINGDSEVIKMIASSVSEWAGNWEAVYDNILLRGKILQELVFAAEKMSKPQLLESKFNVLAISAFHRISENVRADFKVPSSEKVFPLWKNWLNEAARIF